MEIFLVSLFEFCCPGAAAMLLLLLLLQAR